MTRSLVVFSRWSLTPGTLSLETIRASVCGRPRRVVAQDRFYYIYIVGQASLELDDQSTTQARYLQCQGKGLQFSAIHTADRLASTINWPVAVDSHPTMSELPS